MIGRLMIKELKHRWMTSTLVVVVVALTAGICSGLVTLDAAAQKETKRIMRDLGFNLRIIPAETELESFYLRGYAEATMPEDVVHRLAGQKTVAYNHLVASLQRKITLLDQDVLLVGLSGTYFPPGAKKPPMQFEITRGEVHLGWQVASKLELAAGQRVTIGAKEFVVARVMPPARTMDDLRVVVNLADAQEALNLPGRINEIKAIDCLCQTDGDPEKVIQEEVTRVAPEAQAVLVRSLADTRARQRQLVAKVAKIAIPLVLIAAMIVIGVLSFLNTREREAEMGVLHALGYGGESVYLLILGKAGLLGIVGGVIGAVGGSAAAVRIGKQTFELTVKKVAMDPQVLTAVIVAAPLLAISAAFVAAAVALARDPAVVLAGDG
jgi:hypothetical protein